MIVLLILKYLLLLETLDFTSSMRLQLRQEPAKLRYVNPKYVSNFSMYTGRKGRGMPYVTNVTFTLLTPFLNNVTGVLTFQDLGTKNTLSISYKVCDGLNVPWVKKYFTSIMDVPAKCPFPAVTYHFTNMTVPDNLPFQLMPNDYEAVLMFIMTRSKEKLYEISVVLRHEKGLK